VIEAPCDPRQRNRLHQLEHLFFLGGCLDGETGKHGYAAHCKKLPHEFSLLIIVPQFNRFYVASQAIGDQEAAILVFELVP